MKSYRLGASTARLAALALFLFNLPHTNAHCDTLDGPVVKAAQEALAGGDVKLVLHWVQPVDEAEIRSAFRQTLAVRKLTPEARELADRYFFETLVRVHRAGEGAPYTGLKPAGTAVPPAITAADKALQTGNVSSLVSMLHEQMKEGIQARFKNAALKKDFESGDVAAGREYVKAYVEYVHYAEGIQAAADAETGHHAISAGPHATEQHSEPASHAEKNHFTH